jgi:Sec-independent protein translocase protein TatA
VALIIFGPQDLPRIVRSLSRASDELRRVSAELGDALHRDLEALEQEDARRPPTI